MLQQTQVERVIPYYKKWMHRFPTPTALARAPLSDVLITWQGLGYNRRAKALHEVGKILAQQPFPRSLTELQALPGIGPYTAGAVLTFAFNQDHIFIETNIRTVITHHFFPRKKVVPDADIRALLTRMHPSGKGREWYAALMDYGAHLKRIGVRINKKAKGYTKQSSFLGSKREARGALLKRLAKGQASKKELSTLLPQRQEQVLSALTDLVSEGLVEKKGARYQLPI
jgi:A/G-specific adenine glycosylase